MRAFGAPAGPVSAGPLRRAGVAGDVAGHDGPPDRAKLLVRGRSHTEPGSLLKEWIPIWTWAEWNGAVPGFVELDLVGHEVTG